MGEIFCPMCGKSNPAESEVCQFCQARLVPLVFSPAESEPPEAIPEEMPSSIDAAPTGESDWLLGLRSDEPIPSEESLADVEAGGLEDGNLPSDETHISADDVPDWLARLPGESPQEAEAEPLSDWLKEETGETEQPPSKPVEVSDWLSHPLPDEGQVESSESESELAPGEFPSWLEAIRPVKDEPQTVSARGTPERIESAGPLAGLSGVLPAEPDHVRPRKSPTYPLELRVSANQRIHVDLLQGLIESEGRAQPLPQRRGISSQHVLRWTIACVLWGALLWSVITGKQEAPLPAYTEETAEVNRLISQLPGEARVLLAFDYEPGLSAEMDAAATAVVDHLMLRGAYLTLVSTSPTGPILAERFIMKTQSSHHYTSGVNYVNLGYIPGGAMGLLSFVENPQRTLPYTLDTVAAWESEAHAGLPALQGVQHLNDFELLMVIVDDPDLARAWVEQVQPQLNEPDTLTSLVMVTSAQVEPVMRPYFEANPRQVHGFVFGLRGGAAYAQLTGRGELPRVYWGPYGFGLVVAALLILIGGLVLSSVSLLARPPQVKGEANQ